MIDMPKIRAFLAAAECLNFTEAATSMFLTQSTMSKQIAIIESDLGFPLFIRTNRKITLTSEGAFLYKEMRQAVDQIDAAVLLAKKAITGETGSLSLGCLETLDHNKQVKQLIERFIKVNPKIELSINFYPFKILKKELAVGNLDVIITKHFEIETAISTSSLLIFDAQPVLVISNKNSLAQKDSINFTDLRCERFITISPGESLGAHNYLVSYCKQNGFNPKIERYAPDFKTLVLLIDIENYVTIADSSDIPFNSTDIRIIELYSPKPISTVAAWRTENTNHAIPKFCAIINECCEPY